MVRLYNHPLLPLMVYDFYTEVIVKSPRFQDREQAISRNRWAWAVIECKEYVISSLHVPDEDEDILLYENNTIEGFLYVLFTMDRFTFEDGAVPDDIER